MKWVIGKLKELGRGVKTLWKTPRGKLSVIGLSALLVFSVPGIYFSFAEPDKPACLKAENIERTDTWWKTIRYYGFKLAGNPLECKISDVELLSYLKGNMVDQDDPTKVDGQDKSQMIKKLAMIPGAFSREIRVQMKNDAMAEVSFMQESTDRLKIREQLAPALGILSPTLPAERAGINWLGWGSAIIPVLLMLGAVLYLSRNQMGKMVNFQKSKHKMIMPGQGGPTFDQVAGATEAKAALKKYKKFLKDPKRFRRLGARPRKGILLVGPPGNGKTLLARALAEEAGVPMFTISGSDFTEMFVGVGAARVRDMYEAALKVGNCIIFVDEIDAVGFARAANAAASGNNERDGTLMGLLNAMDGINEKGEQIADPDKLGIIWIAATNRPDVLDPALKRPGRLDRLITVPAPGLTDRAKILAIHTKKLLLAEGTDLLEIARLCPGYSGADLANLANEAANIATDRDADQIHLVDFVEARETIEMGAENRSLSMTRMEVLLTSLHEIGHTLLNLAGEAVGHDPFQKVTNIPRGNALGLTWFRPERDKISITRDETKALLATLMGGRAAEELCLGQGKVTSGAGGDMNMAEKRAYQAITQLGFADSPALEGRAWGSADTYAGSTLSEHDKQEIQSEVTKLVKEGHKTAYDHLTEKLQLLYLLTIALYLEETLDRAQVLELIEKYEAEKATLKKLDWEAVVAATVGKETSEK